MKHIINHSTYGEIVYEESFWTGKKNITINNEKFLKINKKNYSGKLNEEDLEPTIIELNGTYLMGVTLRIDSKIIEVVPKIKWYEFILVLLPFVIDMILSFVPVLPILGGALGGLITVLAGFLELTLIRKTESVAMKILIGIIGLILALGVCIIIGTIIVSIAAQVIA